MGEPGNSAVRSANLRGAAIMLVAVASFALMDASLKTLSPHYSPMQVTTLRALSALPIVLVWVAVRGGFVQLLRIRFWLMVMVAVGAGALALPGWRPIQPAHWLPIAAMALTGSLAQWGLTEAFRLGQPSFIAPLEYTALVWGVILDWALWRTLPGALTFVGAAVIIASGVYLLRSERVHAEAEHP